MRSALAILLVIEVFGCRFASRPSGGRYVVTDSPINVGVGSVGLCIAADPGDREGIWWWEPGTAGCASRSTGPGVFHADHATVSQSAQDGPVALSFRLPTHLRPFVDVRLVIEDGGMRMAENATLVRVRRRNDLDVPDGSR
jgi:hypothetical protein